MTIVNKIGGPWSMGSGERVGGKEETVWRKQAIVDPPILSSVFPDANRNPNIHLGTWREPSGKGDTRVSSAKRFLCCWLKKAPCLRRAPIWAKARLAHSVRMLDDRSRLGEPCRDPHTMVYTKTECIFQHRFFTPEWGTLYRCVNFDFDRVHRRFRTCVWVSAHISSSGPPIWNYYFFLWVLSIKQHMTKKTKGNKYSLANLIFRFSPK